MLIISGIIGIVAIILISFFAKKLSNKRIIRNILGVVLSMLLMFAPCFIKCSENVGFHIMIGAISAILFTAVLTLIEIIKQPSFSNILILVVLFFLIGYAILEKQYFGATALEATHVGILMPMGVAIISSMIFPIQKDKEKKISL